MGERLAVVQFEPVRVTQVRRATERVLERTGTFTTDPSRVSPDVTFSAFSGDCEESSRRLQCKLRSERVDTRLVHSATAPSPTHWYLEEPGATPEEDVLIDRTIGQYIINHNHVFVGTRARLRQLVLGETFGYPYHFKFGRPGTEELFEQHWGSTSQLAA